MGRTSWQHLNDQSEGRDFIRFHRDDGPQVHSKNFMLKAKEMDLEKIRADVVAIIADVAEIPEESITDDALLEDLGVDSLMGLEIVANAEKRYRIEIPEEEIPKLKTLRHILDMIQAKFLA